MAEQPQGIKEHPRQRRQAGQTAPPPWLPAILTIEVVGAFQALVRGEAQPHQQKMALDFLIDVLCDTYDQSYRPGPDGDRETCFAEGKRFIGNQVVKILKTDVRTFSQPRGESNG